MKTYSSLPGEGENPLLIPCPVCKGESFSPQWDCQFFSFVKCKTCGAIYQNPQAEASQIHSRYDEEYFSYEVENESSFLNLMMLGLSDVDFFRWEDDLKTRGKVLDVGCATGSLIGWLSQRGWDAEGLEICLPSAQYAKKKRKLPIHTVPLEDAGLTSEAYSLIHSSHVIEHLNDPESMVNQIHRLLIPGGFFVCVTPNSASLQALLYKKNWRSAIADHLVLFSAGRLKRLLKSQGFEVMTWKTWGGIAQGQTAPFLKGILDKLAKKWYFGDVVIVLARKG